MSSRFIIVITLMLMVLALVGCSTTESPETTETTANASDGHAEDFPASMSLRSAKELAAKADDIHLIDVRTPEEFAAGHVAGAQLLTLDGIDSNIVEAYPDKATKLILYCRSGNRSGQALRILEGLGYQNLSNAGGIIDYDGTLVK